MTIVRTEPDFGQGERLAVSLRRAGMYGGDMAVYLGVSRGAVSEWVRGKSEPKLGMLRAWAARTGVSVEWLAEASPAARQALQECAVRDLNPEPAD